MATNERRFFNRELSWLEFNQRVLEEANDPTVPLLERLQFLAITAANLDEFYMVRVGGLHLQIAAALNKTDPAGLTPAEQLQRIRRRTGVLVAGQYACLAERILPGLAAHGVQLVAGQPLAPDDHRALEPFFEAELFPLLTPLAVGGERVFPLLAPLALHLLCRLAPGRSGGPDRYAIVRLGGGRLSRVVRAPGRTASERRFVLIEDLVRAFLPRLFPGQEVVEAACFRLTRNADMAVDEEYASDLSTVMSRVLAERRTAPCVRLEVEAGASAEWVAFLSEHLDVDDDDVFRVPGPVDLVTLRELREAAADPALVHPRWTPQPQPQFDLSRDLFEQIAGQDILLSLPYESFDPVVRLIEAAAVDPAVTAIKMVLYRTGAKSPIVRALAAAARAGKHVTALLELKARFDEARNIDWAHDLEEAGVQVVYGVRNLKTHAKVCLIVRREPGGVRHYLHLGTGNYNDLTARLYTDVGLLTCDPALGRDAAAFFHAITGYSEPQSYLRLVQSPSGLRDRVLELIAYETQLARQQQPAQILAKMNALVDPDIIEALYEASQAGVEIRLCVRGICCLRPGVRKRSANITVTSVVDRFLEHSRIFFFLHGGSEELLISSADWMPRNLDRRIELMVPVQDPACRAKLIEALRTTLADNVKAWQLQPDGAYRRVSRPHGQRRIRSQEEQVNRAVAEAKRARQALRTVFEPHLPREAARK